MTESESRGAFSPEQSYLEEIAVGVRLLQKDSPDGTVMRFFTKMAQTGDTPPNPIEIARNIARFAFDHKDDELPDNPGMVTRQTIDKHMKNFSDDEIKALQYAAGRAERMSRRSFLKNGTAMFGAAFAASGGTAMLLSDGKEPPERKGEDSRSINVTPAAAPLMLVGGLLAMAAGINMQRRKRRENPTAMEAERHLNETMAQLLVDTDKHISKALAAAKARDGEGPAR